MPKYDRQLIIVFLNGCDDALIVDNADALSKKQREKPLESETVFVRPGDALIVEGGSAGFDGDDVERLKKAMRGQLQVTRAITHKSRIYLQGHGHWQSQKLASWNAISVARLLKHVAMPAVDNLNVLGCELARDAGTANHARICNSIDSFASNLHRRLRDPEELGVTLFARPFRPGVVTKELTEDQSMWGRKLTADENDDNVGTVHHRPGSKYKFFWDGFTQKRERVDSTADSLMDVDPFS